MGDVNVRFGSYEAALTYLYSFYRQVPSAVPSNFAVQAALRMLGVSNTPKSNRIMHVTGTNGKGSTAAYLELFLQSMGHETVTLTSPHINSVRERIRLNGAPLRKELFVELLEMTYSILEHLRGTELHPAPTTVITILALLLHEKLSSQCFGIYEVGVGGTHDSTNVFEHALVGLTRVTDDHIDHFDGSIENLLLEKLGLCRPGGTLIHQIQEPSLHKTLNWYCSKHDIDHISVTKAAAHRVRECLDDKVLPGEWQLDNASLAYEMFKRMEPTSPSLQAVSKCIGERSVNHPGRLQSRIIDERHVILDGAHNVPAFRCILHYLENKLIHNDNCVAILGFSENKRWKKMIELIVNSNRFTTFLFTQSTRPRGIPPNDLAAYASTITTCSVMTMANLRTSLGWVLENTSGTIVISGSLLLVGDLDKALHALGLADWADPLEEIDPQQPWMHEL